MTRSSSTSCFNRKYINILVSLFQGVMTLKSSYIIMWSGLQLSTGKIVPTKLQKWRDQFNAIQSELMLYKLWADDVGQHRLVLLCWCCYELSLCLVVRLIMLVRCHFTLHSELGSSSNAELWQRKDSKDLMKLKWDFSGFVFTQVFS